MNLRRKKNFGKIFALLFTAIFMVLLSGCGNKEQANGVSFQENTVTIEKYETYSLKLQGTEDEEIEWKSKDKSIATVRDGVVCGMKKGSTEIFAYIDGKEVSCNVVITDNKYVPVIELGETDTLIMDINGTYALQPSLSYNGNTYTDAKYTYSSDGNAIKVDKNGVITSSKTGEGVVCVEAKWRGNVIETSLAVDVIDASTSIEVSDKVYDIYLNGTGGEWPAKVDLGISIFDKDVPIKEKNAAVKYVEKPMDGDVEGAATVKNGIAYAAKYGTTHYVAEYTSIAGDVVRSTTFTINVLQTPADKYSTPIEGKEFEFFFEPLSPVNSVEWDEDLHAFHLINKNADENDGRGFIFNKQYVENIIKYTNAESIKFEFKTDGIPSQEGRTGGDFWTGFYPNWWDDENKGRYSHTDEWTEIEIFFSDIPRDEEGNLKAIFLLNSYEGFYIRNITLVPKYTGPYLCMDMEINTTGGDWKDDIEVSFVSHAFEGDINNCKDRVIFKAGKTERVRLRLDDLLVNGELPGFGFVLFGGPAWDAKLADGYTPDRTTITIKNVEIEGNGTNKIDLSNATWTKGKAAGFANANDSGVADYYNGVVTITNGFRFDGHKVTFGNPEDAKNTTYLCMDIGITTSGGNWTDAVEVAFFNHSYDGSVGDGTLRKVLYADKGATTEVRLKLDDFLVDGEFPGFGFAILGGPEWDAKLSDGYTPDRTTITLSNVRLEGAKNEAIDLSNAVWTNGTNAGYSFANGSGVASYEDGVVTITNGFRYDGHKVTFGDPEEAKKTTYLCMDMEIATLGGNWSEAIEVAFFNHAYTGSVGDGTLRKVLYADKGETTKIKLKVDDFLVDGELPGFGFAILGGPEWDDKLADGYTPDRTTITVSNVRLEGAKSEAIDLSNAIWTSGTNAGYSFANGNGVASYSDGVVTISNGFRYDGHKVTFGTGETTEPENETYLYMDMGITTTAGDWASPIELGFASHSYEGDINDCGNRVVVTAEQNNEIKLKLDDLLVDGEFPGFGFVIYGGPEWDAKLEDGYTPNRTTITISNVRIEGEETETIDLSTATWVNGTNTGFTNANGSGIASYSDGVVTITNGFRYDGHKVTFGESGSTDEPEVPEEIFLCMDMSINTIGGWTDPIAVRFFNHTYTGSVGDAGIAEQVITADQASATEIRLNINDFLVDGVLPGFGFAIMGGPEWNTEISPGVYDRTTVTVSNVRLEGAVNKAIDLSDATWANGANAGFSWANSSGAASYNDGVVSITNGYRYDGHEVTFAEPVTMEAEPEIPDVPDVPEEIFLCMDMSINTIGGWTDPITVRFFNHTYTGSVGDAGIAEQVITADQAGTTAIRLNINDFLVDGELPGFGFAIMGGPEWNTEISPGVYDRTTVTVSNVRLEGAVNKTIDLSDAAWTNGANSGFSWANSSGVASYSDGVVSITNGYRYDGHEVTFAEPVTMEAEPEIPDVPDVPEEIFLCLDMAINTTGGWTEPITVRFFNHTYTGSVGDAGIAEQVITADQAGTTAIRLNINDFLVDGVLPGFGFAIMGGPEWDAKCADGYTPNRTTTMITNVRLEGGVNKAIDLSDAAWTNGTNGTGFSWANGSGVASYSNGVVSITDGFRYDGHEVTFAEPVTMEAEPEVPDVPDIPEEIFLCLDMAIATKGQTWSDPIEVAFFNYNYDGSVGDGTLRHVLYADAADATEIRLNINDFLVDGVLPGFGFAILGGPEWNTAISDGVYDRTTVTVSNVRLEGAVNKAIDLSDATWANGTNGTGFSWANGSGVASYSNGVVSITDGFRYDGHEVTFAEPVTMEEEPDVPDVPEEIFLCMDMAIATKGQTWSDPIEVAFFNYNYDGSVGDGTLRHVLYADAADATEIRLNINDFLVDGVLPGFGFAILGGPEWNTAISDGVYDRTTVTVSNVRLEGGVNKAIDLSDATWANGTNGTGFSWANGSGVASYSNGVVSITDGFRYDGHEVTFAEPVTTEEEPDVPDVPEEIFLCLDMSINTTGGWTEPITVRFFNHTYTGSVGDAGIAEQVITADQAGATAIRLNINDFLVDGVLPGFGFAIMGGPEWDAKCADGYTPNRTTTTITNVRLEGGVNKTIDLSSAVWTNGANSGFSWANSSGAASYSDGVVSITNGYRYDGHEVTFAEAVTMENVVVAEANWFSTMMFRIKRFITEIFV